MRTNIHAGLEVAIERFGRELSDSAVREFALDRNERIYFIRKPPTAKPAAGQ